MFLNKLLQSQVYQKETSGDFDAKFLGLKQDLLSINIKMEELQKLAKQNRELKRKKQEIDRLLNNYSSNNIELIRNIISFAIHMDDGSLRFVLKKYLLEKELIENKLLTGMNAETEINNIFKSLDLVDSNNITNTFRYLFKRMIVIDRLHLVFIIGRESINGLDLKNLKTCLNGTYVIKVRAQLYKANFGIYINA